MALQKNTVLVVDDMLELRQELAYLLEDTGYKVLQAENGKIALVILQLNPVDLMITDIFMPEMDGIELLLKVKQSFADLPIILISGGGRYVADSNEYDYLETTRKLTGVEHILKKPFDDEILVEMVGKLLKAA